MIERIFADIVQNSILLTIGLRGKNIAHNRNRYYVKKTIDDTDSDILP